MRKFCAILCLTMFALSCSSDDSTSFKPYLVNVEFSSNTKDFPVLIYGHNIGSKDFVNFHKETVRIDSKNASFTATSKDKRNLLTIKVFDSKGKLIIEKSRNNLVVVNLN